MSLFNTAVANAGAALALATMTALATPAFSQGAAKNKDLSGFKAEPTELALLPRYCWASFNEKFRGPGTEAFNLPTGCGERFNHFCPGVLSLTRAKASLADPQRRSYWIGVAADHMRYTVNGIKDLPACPMRPTVDAMVEEIRALQASQR